MRIGFMGVQGTGKSTLVDMFLSEYNYTRSVNIQRILNSSYSLNINGGADYLTQYAITAHYASEVVAYENYISDRTVLDTFVYAKTCNRISSEEISNIESIFSKAVEHYDVIFYLPVEFEPPHDGVRIISQDYRDEVLLLMEEYTDKYNHKIVTLTGSIEERYLQMTNTLNNIKGLSC